jgi:hypothetical protein
VPVVHEPRVNELVKFVVNKLISNGTFAETVAKLKFKLLNCSLTLAIYRIFFY